VSLSVLIEKLDSIAIRPLSALVIKAHNKMNTGTTRHSHLNVFERKLKTDKLSANNYITNTECLISLLSAVILPLSCMIESK